MNKRKAKKFAKKVFKRSLKGIKLNESILVINDVNRGTAEHPEFVKLKRTKYVVHPSREKRLSLRKYCK